MTKPMMDLGALVEKSGDTDLLREMIGFAAERLMELEVGAKAGAGYGEKSVERLAQRNGYRERDWQTRAGTIELRIPKLRTGSYFPSFLEPRRAAEKALVAVIQEAYVHGVSTRAMDDLMQAIGGTGVSKSQVRRLCEEIDERVDAFLARSIEGEWRAPAGLNWWRHTGAPVGGRDLPEGPPERTDRFGRGHHRRGCEHRRAARCVGLVHRRLGSRDVLDRLPARAHTPRAVGREAGDQRRA